MDQDIQHSFLIRVLRCVSERYLPERKIARIYEGMYPPPRLSRGLDAVRQKLFKEKPEPREPLDLTFPLAQLVALGFVKKEMRMDEHFEEVSHYMLSDKGRAQIRKKK